MSGISSCLTPKRDQPVYVHLLRSAETTRRLQDLGCISFTFLITFRMASERFLAVQLLHARFMKQAVVLRKVAWI